MFQVSVTVLHETAFWAKKNHSGHLDSGHFFCYWVIILSLPFLFFFFTLLLLYPITCLLFYIKGTSNQFFSFFFLRLFHFFLSSFWQLKTYGLFLTFKRIHKRFSWTMFFLVFLKSSNIKRIPKRLFLNY